MHRWGGGGVLELVTQPPKMRPTQSSCLQGSVCHLFTNSDASRVGPSPIQPGRGAKVQQGKGGGGGTIGARLRRIPRGAATAKGKGRATGGAIQRPARMAASCGRAGVGPGCRAPDALHSTKCFVTRPPLPNWLSQGGPPRVGRGGVWFGLGLGLFRTSGPTERALTRASRLGRPTHGCPVSRPAGLLTAPVPPRWHTREGDVGRGGLEPDIPPSHTPPPV